MKPELVAVGCNDPYVRIFDRRQLKAKASTAINFVSEQHTMEGIGYFSPDRTTLPKIYDIPNSRVLNSMVQSKSDLVAFKAARLSLLIFKSTGVME